MTSIVVLGLQRSGTNFTEQLIKKNIKQSVIANTWGKPRGIWKHSYDIDVKPANGSNAGARGSKEKYEGLGRLVKCWYIHKNPYSWIESIVTRQVDIKKTYPRTVRNNRTQFEIQGLDLDRLCELYRDHTAFWFRVCKEKRVFHLSYEDLIRTPESTRLGINAFASFYGLSCTPPEKVLIPEKVSQSDKFSEESRDKYKGVKLKILNWKQIVRINNILDHDMVRWQGYDLITTQEKFEIHRI